MKFLLLVPALLGSTMASAQLRTTAATTSTEQMRSARKMMESQTEMTVLEKLEEARMNDERIRREKFETLNFNMVPEHDMQATQNSGY